MTAGGGSWQLAANSSGWQLETGDVSGGWWLGASVGGVEVQLMSFG